MKQGAKSKIVNNTVVTSTEISLEFADVTIVKGPGSSPCVLVAALDTETNYIGDAAKIYSWLRSSLPNGTLAELRNYFSLKSDG